MRRIAHLAASLLILGFTLICLFSFVRESEGYERKDSAWERPIFQDNRWLLEGITEDSIKSMASKWGQVDVVKIRYGNGMLWTVAGLANEDGNYESWVRGIEDRQQLMKALQQPRRVTLSVPGTLEGVSLEECTKSFSPACQMIFSLEHNQPGLGIATEAKESTLQSNVFIQTGTFPDHYLYGVLTWEMDLGEIIEQGLEGF